MKSIRFLLERLRRSKLDYFLRLVYIALCQFIGFFLSHVFAIKPKRVVIESFNGKHLCDSPLALLLEMDGTLFGWEFVIVINDKVGKLQNLTGNNRVTYVRFGGVQYYISYFTSKFHIVNCRLPYLFYKKRSQILVQTWHGVPLKKIGIDIEVDNHPTASKASIRLAYLLEGRRSDYFLSSSDYLTDKLCSAFKIERSKVIPFGLPRNDALLMHKSRCEIRKELNIPEDKKIILYAPTYRDTNYDCGMFRTTNPLDNEKFCSYLSEKYVFLFRGHYFSEKVGDEHNFINVSNIGDINELLLVTDVLITDYSSIMFDYSILKKPIYFYHPDFNEYAKETRGMYFDLREECPKIQCDSIDKLLYLIDNEVRDDNYLVWNEKFMSYNDINTSERIVRLVVAHSK